MTYNELKTELQKAPATWVPGLLIALVESAYLRGKIFLSGGASRLAEQAEKQAAIKVVQQVLVPLPDQSHPGDGRDGGRPARIVDDEF